MDHPTKNHSPQPAHQTNSTSLLLLSLAAQHQKRAIPAAATLDSINMYRGVPACNMPACDIPACDVPACNTDNYGDALYWDERYIQQGGSFEWYQRYADLRPFVRKYIHTSSRVLMIGCGNSVMSEDMVKDGYEDIMNIDISLVAIDMMRRKYKHIPQLKYIQMDVKDMSFFTDESFDGVIDKGTLDSLMCGTNAPVSAAQMLGEVSRLLKPGGHYLLITYGDPTVRIPHLRRPEYNWSTELYIIPKAGFQRLAGSTSIRSYLEPAPIAENGLLPADFVLEDPNSHYIYVCRKMDETIDTSHVPSYALAADML